MLLYLDETMSADTVISKVRQLRGPGGIHAVKVSVVIRYSRWYDPCTIPPESMDPSGRGKTEVLPLATDEVWMHNYRTF